MSSRLAIILFAIVSAWIIYFKNPWTGHTLSYDKSGYYLYLPATFIYDDLETLNFFQKVSKDYGIMNGDYLYGLYEQPSGKRLNKYAIGVSVVQFPFFMAAHYYCKATEHHPADGYSKPYLYAVIISTLFASIAGLVLIRKFLLKFFTDRIVLFTLAAIAFGTNLFFYTAFDQGMSHTYSFFFFAALLYTTERLYSTNRARHIIWLGFILGMITIIRPINIVAGIIPLLWGVNSLEAFKSRFIFLKSKSLPITIAAILFLLVAFIQMSYWKYITGHWIFYSYGQEGFNFSRPKIWDGLLSYRKGWFIYTPIAFVGFLGLFSMRRQFKTLIPCFLIFFPIIIYLVFSWSSWSYGGSFGCRPLIETLPVLALPLASLFHYIYNLKNGIWREFFTLVILFFIWLNLLQSYQYSKGIIHWDRMTEKYYWKVFGKPDVDFGPLEHYLL